MLHLTLAGLSDDGTRLLLVSDAGEQFTLAVDGRLRAALRGEHARLGQLEIKMDSTLRPRDIQARIRAGETPEAVAQAAQTTVDKVMPYANPVLAERAHIADRAQRSSVRRRAGDTGARTLGEAVAAQLRAENVPADSVEWDAWRREDGRWTLQATFAAGKRKGRAGFVFDAPGNYVTTEDDDARWLVGDAPSSPAPDPGAAPAGTATGDDLTRARKRRLTAVPADELPLGDDALHLANEDVDFSPTPEPLADEPAREHPPAEPDEEVAAEPDEEESTDEPVDEPTDAPAPRRPAKKKGRASVPSWDEIMFGGGDRG